MQGVHETTQRKDGAAALSGSRGCASTGKRNRRDRRRLVRHDKDSQLDHELLLRFGAIKGSVGVRWDTASGRIRFAERVEAHLEHT
jgi:hypothetical protein